MVEHKRRKTSPYLDDMRLIQHLVLPQLTPLRGLLVLWVPTIGEGEPN